MVSYDVAWACPLQPAPAIFIEDAHILRASSSTVCACISKRPAIARIACGSVIKRVGMLPVSLLLGYSGVCCHERRRSDRFRASRTPGPNTQGWSPLTPADVRVDGVVIASQSAKPRTDQPPKAAPAALAISVIA